LTIIKTTEDGKRIGGWLEVARGTKKLGLRRIGHGAVGRSEPVGGALYGYWENILRWGYVRQQLSKLGVLWRGCSRVRDKMRKKGGRGVRIF